MSDATQSRRRALMVALDAMEITLFDKLLAAGRLPNLARYARESHRLDVLSEGQSLHGSVWPTFSSGTKPGKHGVMFWTQWFEEEMAHLRNDDPRLHYDPFWAAIAEAGRRAIVVDVPYVPLVRHPGVLACEGWGLHDEIRPKSWPEDFRTELNRSFGKSPLSFDTVEPQSPADKLAMSRDMTLSTQRRAEILLALAAREDWDLLLMVSSETHKLGHYLAIPEQLDANTDNEAGIAAPLRALDAQWPAILDAVGPECDVSLFALHGFTPQVDYGEYLRQVIDLILGGEPVDHAAQPDLVRRMRNLLPDRVHRAIWARLPGSVRARRVAQQYGGGDATAPLFPVAFDGNAAARVSLRGRERDGIVDGEERERLIAELERLGTSLRTDDGEQAFIQMMRPQEVFPGPRAHRLPDAMLLANPAVIRAPRLHIDGKMLVSTRVEARNGDHTGRGFCYYRPGEGGRAPARKLIETVDFAPTALRLLGIEPPAGLDGSSFLS
jgi:predicted AlkP superfamily phosphohydrolase/phosphomutase